MGAAPGKPILFYLGAQSIEYFSPASGQRCRDWGQSIGMSRFVEFDFWRLAPKTRLVTLFHSAATVQALAQALERDERRRV
ncbi:hypothetical protein [Saccharopolyspora pogona]|uniref:hypothetical protein n=1 Tax=Saccharopolyspora pogona TaxID=333966 RepID=UPI001681D7BE|nr:hypothetical protein [Saccharopolyspora pogona]